ncbi:unnamed protein product [Leptosia nina]|uniref:PWWP domain-containing protein n=1 Tax=Leptosia nina TaxID=320188 RepID=A0AAV1J4G2_9NEOP
MLPIRCWKLGDIALGKICQKVYAKVKVVKNEDGIFYDDKVLGISTEGDDVNITQELCYYVEILRTAECIWLPYTSMFLAERSRPFYGIDRAKQCVKRKPELTTIEERMEDFELNNSESEVSDEEHFSDVEFNSFEEDGSPNLEYVDLEINIIPPLWVHWADAGKGDQNVSYPIRDTPLMDEEFAPEDPFEEFMRRHEERLFDSARKRLNQDDNKDLLHYINNIDASTENKFNAVLSKEGTKQEIENYLFQCWKHNYEYKTKTAFPEEPSSILSAHINWCLVCGRGDHLIQCSECPSSFHSKCKKNWPEHIVHRKDLQKEDKSVVVDKILSSTRFICTVQENIQNKPKLCPSCIWGPSIGYDDIVWHKLGHLTWWPARVLCPSSIPSCLLSNKHTSDLWPIKYYGTLNHSWAELNRLCLFQPKHFPTFAKKDEELRRAVADASDDYVAVYLS